jgi:hypothetical protein
VEKSWCCESEKMKIQGRKFLQAEACSGFECVVNVLSIIVDIGLEIEVNSLTNISRTDLLLLCKLLSLEFLAVSTFRLC